MNKDLKDLCINCIICSSLEINKKENNFICKNKTCNCK